LPLPLQLSGLPPNTWFLVPTAVHNQTACRLGQPFFWSSPESLPIIYNWGDDVPPTNTWSLGPTQVHHPNSNGVGSAVFAGVTLVSNIETDIHTQATLH